MICNLVTEERNRETLNIDESSTLEILRTLNKEDEKVSKCVSKSLSDIARAVDLISEALKNGGRLIYVGCGTSGRLAMCDAAECPPTFGVSPEQVQVILAGGQKAAFCAVEGSEDDAKAGIEEMHKRRVSDPDIVVGITASGHTPFVLGVLKECKKAGIKTIGICNNINSPMKTCSDVCIEVPVGAEAIMGSTRMKAGTSQKMILNMISTTVMIKLGKVYENLMVDVQPTNNKLIQRSHRIISLATGVSEKRAKELLIQSKNNCKIAIVMQILGITREEAESLLSLNGGYVKKTINKF